MSAPTDQHQQTNDRSNQGVWVPSFPLRWEQWLLLGLLIVSAYYAVYFPFRNFSVALHHRIHWKGEELATVQRVREKETLTFSLRATHNGRSGSELRVGYQTTSGFVAADPNCVHATVGGCGFTEVYNHPKEIGTHIPFLYNPQDPCGESQSESKAHNNSMLASYGTICGVEALLFLCCGVMLYTFCSNRRDRDVEDDQTTTSSRHDED